MRKMNMGGSVPRQTTIQGQRHDLAYINPFEVDLLESYNATPGGVAGPGNVPAYPPGDGGFSPDGGGGYSGGGGFAGFGGSEGPSGGYSSPGAAAQQQAAAKEAAMAAADAAIAGQMAAAAQEAANAAAAQEAAQETAAQEQAAKQQLLESIKAKTKGAAFQDLALSLQQQKDDAASKTGLEGLIARAKLAIDPQQKQQVFDDVMGKKRDDPSAFQSMMQKVGLTGPTPTSFNPVYDKQGNLVGSAGIDKDGNVVSYSGDRTANLADGDVKDRVDAMNAAGSTSGTPATNDNISPPDLPPIDMDPCPAGFVMDAATNVCVPVGVGGGDGGVDEDDPVDPLPPYVPPSEVVGPPSYTPIGGLGSFVPTPLQPYPTQQRYQIMPQPMVTMMVGEEQG